MLKKKTFKGLLKKDVEFHDIIYRSSRNEKLIQIASNLREQIQRFRVIYLKDFSSTKDIIKEHNDIFEAIQKRDPQLAQELMLKSILISRKRQLLIH